MSNQGPIAGRAETYYERVANSGLRVKPPFPTLASTNPAAIRNLVLPPAPASAPAAPATNGNGGAAHHESDSDDERDDDTSTLEPMAVDEGDADGVGEVVAHTTPSKRSGGGKGGLRRPEECPYCEPGRVFKSVLSHMASCHAVDRDALPGTVDRPDDPATTTQCPAPGCSHYMRWDSLPHHATLRHPGYLSTAECPEWLAAMGRAVRREPRVLKRGPPPAAVTAAADVAPTPTKSKKRKAPSSSSSDSTDTSPDSALPIEQAGGRGVSRSAAAAGEGAGDVAPPPKRRRKKDPAATPAAAPVDSAAAARAEVHGASAPAAANGRVPGVGGARRPGSAARRPATPAPEDPLPPAVGGPQPSEGGVGGRKGRRVAWAPSVVAHPVDEGSAPPPVRRKRAHAGARAVDSGASGSSGGAHTETASIRGIPGFGTVPFVASPELDVGAGMMMSATTSSFQSDPTGARADFLGSGSRLELALVATLMKEAAAVGKGSVEVPEAFSELLSTFDMGIALRHLTAMGMRKPRMVVDVDFHLTLQWDRTFVLPRNTNN